MKVELEENGKVLVLDDHYPIELDRIPDERALLQWIEHLGEKRWVDRDGIRKIIRTVFSAKGWELYKNI